MPLNHKQKKEIMHLLVLSLDGAASMEQLESLNQILKSSSEARQFYLKATIMGQSVREMNWDSIERYNNDLLISNDLWLELAENERTAEAVIVDKPDTQDNFAVLSITDSNRNRQISKLSIYTAIVSSAALIFILLLALLSPVDAPVIAKVIGLSGAKWDPAIGSVEIGKEVRAGQLVLLEGFVEFDFMGKANVIIQAPAKFNIEGQDQIFLFNGKLSSVVHETGVGFTVRTPGATVVDYGTEFGVIAHSDGYTEAHVFKGQVDLRTGSNPKVFENAKRLTSGVAGLVDSRGTLTKVKLKSKPAYFVRRVPETTGFAGAGRRLDLADIVGGGSGFGTGRQDMLIDPDTGKITSDYIYENRTASGDYKAVAELPYVDGVFVPDGGERPVQVSSANHFFKECPNTNGEYFRNIANGFQLGKSGDFRFRNVMAGRKYGTLNAPAISMHTNAGITFDLGAIRSGTPGVDIERFTALCGVSGQAGQRRNYKAKFIVLVDGVKRYEVLGSHNNLISHPVNVLLKDEDRFLTLITLGHDGIATDWCMFAMPGLELAMPNNQ